MMQAHSYVGLPCCAMSCDWHAGHMCCMQSIIDAWQSCSCALPGLRLALTCADQVSCVSCAGSYSFVGLHASSKTYDDLAKPVQRRVLFAGEHTCKVRRSAVSDRVALCAVMWGMTAVSCSLGLPCLRRHIHRKVSSYTECNMTSILSMVACVFELSW